MRNAAIILNLVSIAMGLGVIVYALRIIRWAKRKPERDGG